MACIYEILVGTDDNYIGSTFDIIRRERMHNTNVKFPSHNNGESKLYRKIRECDGKFIIHKLYDVDTDNELELRKAEREAYDNLKPTLNERQPYQSNEERKEYIKNYNKVYKEQNSEILNEKRKIYRQRDDVKKRISDYEKEYRKNNPEKIKEQKHREYEKNKERYTERNKQWRENNADKKKEMDKAYYERTKEQQKIKNKERYENNKVVIKCECGVEVLKRNMKKHLNSKKHLQFTR